MSLQSWKAEFYPVKPKKGWTTLKAVQHSLRKWEGALPKNCKKHGVVFEELDIKEYAPDQFSPDLDIFEFGSKSCALCVKYQKYNASTYTDICGKCPLNNNGPMGFGCDGKSAFAKSWDDPKPMIRALCAVVKKLEAK